MLTVKHTDRRLVGGRHDPASVPPYRPGGDLLPVRASMTARPHQVKGAQIRGAKVPAGPPIEKQDADYPRHGATPGSNRGAEDRVRIGSNGIANAGHEPGARFVSGAGLLDDAVEFQP
jgi:hypothetical protein